MVILGMSVMLMIKAHGNAAPHEHRRVCAVKRLSTLVHKHQRSLAQEYEHVFA